jgi:hypothetical protein
MHGGASLSLDPHPKQYVEHTARLLAESHGNFVDPNRNIIMIKAVFFIGEPATWTTSAWPAVHHNAGAVTCNCMTALTARSLHWIHGWPISGADDK